jgi:hypothetical protein
MTRPSIFIVYPGSILTHSGGATRALAMAKAVKEAGFRISLVTQDHDRLALIESGLFEEVHLFKSNLLIRLKTRTIDPSYIARSINIEFNDYVIEMIRQTPPLAVISHYVWTAGLFAELPSQIVTILDTIDIQYRRTAVAKASGIRQFDRVASKREELQELHKAQVVVAIQQEEKTILEQLLPSKTVICSTHSLTVKPLSSPDNSKAILFVGSNYDPNIQGITRFITVAWPRIRAAVPSATLQVCGKVCESLYDYHNELGVQLLGEVPDIEPYYQKAAVIINASLYGTGLPIKTSEALAFGKCLVCNESGARGFDRSVFPGRICDYETMPKHIIPLLEDLSERRKMESTTAEYANRYMTPEVIFKDLITILDQVRTTSPLSPAQIPRHNIITRLRNYPLRKLYYHYAAVLFTHLFEFHRAAGPGDGRLLEMYLRLRWRNLHQEHGIKRVAIYGAGKHTRWMEWALRTEALPKVVAVLDDQPTVQCSLFGLSPSSSRDFDPRSVDSIILSSDCIQDKLAKRCRELYGQQVQLIDLYEGLPPGPYKK